MEEVLFEQGEQEFVMIYINQDAVVCGKHQNAVAETNAEFLFEHNVPLIRRFSGGGTVYHDKGNLNLSFITTGKDSKVIDFKRYAESMVRFLKSLGVKAALTERNDVAIDGFKISGHAAHAKNKRALHHGTLLFDSKLQRLSEGLRSAEDKFQSRAVKSVRSPVTNVRQYLKNDLDINEFTEMLTDYLVKDFSLEGTYVLSREEDSAVRELAGSKYSTFDWNYGYGPDYSFSIKEEIGGQRVELDLDVSEGRFTKVEVGKNTKFDLSWSSLRGQAHAWKDISDFLSSNLDPDSASLLTKAFF